MPEGTNIATQITRIANDRNTIRNKMIDFGLAESTANLDALATAVDGIANNGAVSAQVKEGETYTIPKGYHNGSGTVSGVAGGGNYNLQSKSITPTKSQQNVTPDEGYYGLSDVTVQAIPQAYQDVSTVTATAKDVLANKVIVGADGSIITGTMPNNGAVAQKLDGETTSYTVPAGYHDGKGTVSVTVETKSATPTKEEQTITPTEGSLLSSVTVGAIPAEYVDTTDGTATAAQILTGRTAYVAGEKVTGTMPNNGAVSQKLDTTTTSYAVPAGYHNGSGTVSITTETKSATPSKKQQTVTPTEGSVLSSVTVNAIPAEYADTSDATATAAQILTGQTAYVDGEKVTGTMPNNSPAATVLDAETASYTIPAGYHDGTGSVSLSLETKSATPTKAQQTIEPSDGKVLSAVTVEAIPAQYVDTSSGTAAAGDILTGKTAFVNGVAVTGSMPNNGATNLTIDGMQATSVSVPAGYTTGGTVSLTDSIEKALAAI